MSNSAPLDGSYSTGSSGSDGAYNVYSANSPRFTAQPSTLSSSAGSIVESETEYDLSGASTPVLRRSDSVGSVSFIDLSKLLFVSDFDFGMKLDSVGDSTKKKFKDMHQKTKKQIDKYKSRSLEQELAKLQARLNSRLQKFDERILANLKSSSTEKLFYAMAVFLIAALGFVIGKYPTYFPHFHTALLCVLMPIRFYTYFKQSFQYYLADLCYYVNLLLMAFIWLFPGSKSLFISVFALSMGTLSFAVITWRNSLVLHLIEKTTSSFIHVMPPVTMFVIVHELPSEYVAIRYPAVSLVTNWNFYSGIFWTLVYYTLWQVAYHYFITIKRKTQIENGRVTSFTHMKKAKSSSALGKFVNRLPYVWMQIATFTLIQFGYQLLTMVFVPIWFTYKHACGTFVTFIFVWASYNGATYYIDVFGKRFQKEVEKLKLEIQQLQEQLQETARKDHEKNEKEHEQSLLTNKKAEIKSEHTVKVDAVIPESEPIEVDEKAVRIDNLIKEISGELE